MIWGHAGLGHFPQQSCIKYRRTLLMPLSPGIMVWLRYKIAKQWLSLLTLGHLAIYTALHVAFGATLKQVYIKAHTWRYS